MASIGIMDGIIKFVTAEYRPCYVGVDRRKALFHKWEECSKIVAPSPMVGGHGGGVLKYTYGIVEYESGKIAEVLPTEIQFADDKIQQYGFCETTDKTQLLSEEIEVLQKRLKHLLQSELIRMYDECDRKTGTYKRDIKELDEDYKIKHSAYYLLKSLKTCNECAKKNTCKYISFGDRVVYNCPHYEE